MPFIFCIFTFGTVLIRHLSTVSGLLFIIKIIKNDIFNVTIKIMNYIIKPKEYHE